SKRDWSSDVCSSDLCHLSAHADPFVLVMRSFDHVMDQAQQCRMVRLVQIRYILIHAVGCECILDQVIRTDAEEVHDFRKLICKYCSGWNLDHDADFDIVADVETVRLQFITALDEECVRLFEFCDRCDHREHHFQMPVDARTEQRTQLGSEEIFIIQSHTDCTVA